MALGLSLRTLLFCVVFFIFHTFQIVVSERKPAKMLVHFDVKPGGQIQEHVESWHGTTCKFIYACQGGTNEKWQMTMFKGDGPYVCQVERPDGNSYLFFQKFKMQIEAEDTTITTASGTVSGGVPLNSDEINVDLIDKSVSNTDSFKSSLSKLYVHFTRSAKQKQKKKSKEL